ncbi:MAG TPA: hypothetical protein VFU81_05955 [Thermomicrobiales bacterium]|nr:hypothetical protein [Thermomicrobiales bacterium]
MPPAASTFGGRLAGVLRLDDAAYQTVARDPAATAQAVAVGVVAAFANGVGGLGASNRTAGFAGGVLQGLLWWIALTVAASFFGGLIVRDPAARPAPAAVGRTMGFAQAPHLLLIFGAVPIVGLAASAIATLWGLLTAFTALRVTFRLSLSQALAAGVVAFVVAFVVSDVLTRSFG